jgi:hypothetical protein
MLLSEAFVTCAQRILISFLITVSEGFDSTLAGAKKKKKKQVI